MTRSEVGNAIGDGGRTFQIAKRCGVTTSVARYHLRALERSGWVKRDERLSSENDIYWRPVPPTPPWFKPLMATFERLGFASDSDRNPDGEDRNGLRAEPESAGREPASPNPEQESQQ